MTAISGPVATTTAGVRGRFVADDRRRFAHTLVDALSKRYYACVMTTIDPGRSGPTSIRLQRDAQHGLHVSRVSDGVSDDLRDDAFEAGYRCGNRGGSPRDMPALPRSSASVWHAGFEEGRFMLMAW